ncbi:MAG TPA: ATP-grasp domain-containing protein [Bryobacteraceae bacterium]|nr:ATP-grasp domain-containing protein [Bryobacteraceae bacterium]
MPRILLVAATTGYQTRAFADAARRLKFDLILATDRCHVLGDPWGDRAIPVRFEDSYASRDVIAETGSFDAVVALGDRPTLLAALVAEKLGIAHNTPSSVIACHDKYVTRQRFRAAGLAVPEFFRVPLAQGPASAADQAGYPCVLKPLGLSGSRGVIRANDRSEFLAAFERIGAILESTDVLVLQEDQNRYIQVETFIDGSEFALEGLLTGGKLQVLAIFDKPDPLNGPFFEETIYVTPSRAGAATEQALITAVEKACNALGLSHGPVHAEMRFNSKGVWVLEVAARPIGGLCARALRFDGDMPLEELILRHAVGEDVSGVRRSQPASGVMMIPIPTAGIYQGVSGVERARVVADIEDVIVTAKEGQKILRLPEGASYLGFIFARSGTPEKVESALREAHRYLEFDIATALPVVRR